MFFEIVYGLFHELFKNIILRQFDCSRSHFATERRSPCAHKIQGNVFLSHHLYETTLYSSPNSMLVKSDVLECKSSRIPWKSKNQYTMGQNGLNSVVENANFF